jgi:hypothetical protein
MRKLLFVVLLPLFTLNTHAATLYTQPPSNGGGLYQSSWWDPDGSDYDQYVWDNFTLVSSEAVTGFEWRGGYDPTHFGMGGPAVDFSVAIYSSIPAGTQPDVGNYAAQNPLVEYQAGGNAGETSAGTFGGVQMYDYHFTLPSPFQATGGVKYWVQIEAYQHGIPDWGVSVGTGGDNGYFRRISAAADIYYQSVSGNVAFTVLGSSAPTCTIIANAEPPNAGAIQGAGSYPIGSNVSLVAAANAGFGFVNWTENGTQVSTNATYTFIANVSRTLVANFTPAFIITTSASPDFGGTTSGDGVYNSGVNVTVVASENAGFVFVDWTEFGTEVSVNASYTFPADADRTLVANFAQASNTAVFDLDTGTPVLSTGQGLEFDQTSNGVTAHFSSPDGAVFSIQTDSSTQYHLPQFSGHYLYPNNMSRNRLNILFDHPLESISLIFATVDYAAETEVPGNLNLTAYVDSTANPSVGSASARGTYAGASYPQGTLTFNSAVPFNLIQLVVPFQTSGTTSFFVDNLSVGLTSAPVPTVTATPTDTPLPIATPTATMIPTVTPTSTSVPASVDPGHVVLYE